MYKLFAAKKLHIYNLAFISKMLFFLNYTCVKFVSVQNIIAYKKALLFYVLWRLNFIWNWIYEFSLVRNKETKSSINPIKNSQCFKIKSKLSFYKILQHFIKSRRIIDRSLQNVVYFPKTLFTLFMYNSFHTYAIL